MEPGRPVRILAANEGEVRRRIESCLERHFEARFSHGLCPACLKRHHSEAVGGPGSG